jgi:hypothetical protein
MRLRIVPLPTEVAENLRITVNSAGYGFPRHRQPPGRGAPPAGTASN